ncbi:GNAT family N-acetyltransferase [Mucilaginibacter sp. Bleaf8]|uniref:GNAT family N-acetyltransferase n=1 Tax=Mucilaginibacter sp. Bleaf8 TaxID=2834430 RepID=UPI001BCCC2FD|nr:GNAT family N-acetyltransferase [Mucilaginibacter sp. Bleaf8]MBS7566282.1 GNAT family N-acetyltransferase [Mucilaginibacter sp. Bleaf8]
MVKFISGKDVLPLRNEVLRDGRLQLHECVFSGDELAESFHLGYFRDEQLVCVASFHSQDYKEYTGRGYQLRGMATAPGYQGKGLGTQLVNFATVYLKGQGANYMWCNARKVAVSFYQNSGFEVISDEFEISGIGPHYVMYLKIQ